MLHSHIHIRMTRVLLLYVVCCVWLCLLFYTFFHTCSLCLSRLQCMLMSSTVRLSASSVFRMHWNSALEVITESWPFEKYKFEDLIYESSLRFRLLPKFHCGNFFFVFFLIKCVFLTELYIVLLSVHEKSKFPQCFVMKNNIK